MFSQVCVCSTFGGGVGYPISGLDGGGYPISGLDGGGVPHPRSGWWGGTPSQVWMVEGGHPIPGLDGGGYPVPPRSGWWEYPIPGLDGTGVSTSIASTCYIAGGMPLAFMQEDFLVQEI